LRQAIMMRLLTPVGELAGLGHPFYGSRLPDLVGRRNTETTRNLVRLYILESLKQEARVEKVTKISVTQVDKQPNLISVELEVQPIDSTDVIHIGPFTLSLN
jgi:phage baseplate assembly protein W